MIHAIRARAGLFLASILAALLGGCATSDPPLPPPPAPNAVRPRFLAVLTPGVTIYDEAGNWSLSEGDDPVPPPFESDLGGVTVNSVDELIDLHPRYQERGARTVRVRVPGRQKPLYGLLALLPVMETTSESSARRAYRIAIPAERVEQALGAQISIVAQPYEATVLQIGQADTSSVFSNGQPRRHVVTDPLSGEGYWETYLQRPVTGFSWLLWLSDAPFAGHDPAWEEPR